MHPLLAPFIYGLPALFVGFAAGRYTRREVEHEIVAAADPSKEAAPVPRNLWRQAGPLARVLAIVVLILTFVSATLVSVQTKVTADRDACSTDVVVALIDAINERNTLTDEAAEANSQRLHAQLAFLRATLARSPDVREKFDAYVDALEQYLEISDKQATQRREHPYPTVDQIEACRP